MQGEESCFREEGVSQRGEGKGEGEREERELMLDVLQLRDIEIIIGARLESGDTGMTEIEREQLLQMQAILYSTEVCSLSPLPPSCY